MIDNDTYELTTLEGVAIRGTFDHSNLNRCSLNYVCHEYWFCC